MHDLADAVEAAESNRAIRTMVVTGAGDRAFCAGVDLRAFADGDSDAGGDGGGAPAAFMRLVSGEVTVPVIAAVNGVAVGAGCELAFGSDLVVASETASFGLPEIKRGLFAGSGVMHAGRRLPLGIALELALTGDRIDASRAYELGFVNAVVPQADVLRAALALADKVAANAPLSLAATKELVRKAAYGSPDAQRRLEEWQRIVFTSEDAKEGAMAFLEKRDPVWKGQ
jgi:enoyl-CoA hydratase/carnithine racemase